MKGDERLTSLKSSLIELPLGDNEEFFLSQQLIMQLTHVVIIEGDMGAKTDQHRLNHQKPK